MKITFTGSHGVGKSTLVNEMYFVLHKRYPELVKIDGIPRMLYEKEGIVLNKKGNIDTQMRILSENIKILENYKSFIIDRSILDPYVYSLFNDKTPQRIINILLLAVQEYINKYDYIFYIPIEFPIVKDGIRSEDIKYQKEIDNAIKEKLNIFADKYYTITGSIEERKRKILEIIGSDNNDKDGV